jgi:hypothetical protein
MRRFDPAKLPKPMKVEVSFTEDAPPLEGWSEVFSGRYWDGEHNEEFILSAEVPEDGETLLRACFVAIRAEDALMRDQWKVEEVRLGMLARDWRGQPKGSLVVFPRHFHEWVPNSFWIFRPP